MSQLSRLIEQARKTRHVNDIFNIQPTVVRPQEDAPPADELLVRLTDLESGLFGNPSLADIPVEDFVSELETISRLLK